MITIKIGVFVGSFNPVHKGHIKIVNELINKKYVDKVIIVPTCAYWDKHDLVDLKDRINMLKLYEREDIIIDEANNRLKYTIDILNSIKNNYKHDEIYLIIGADQLPKFHLWHKIDEILKFKILIIKRNDIDINSYLKDNFIITDIDNMNMSSTEVRNGKYDFLDRKVYDYIKDNNLYKEVK